MEPGHPGGAHPVIADPGDERMSLSAYRVARNDMRALRRQTLAKVFRPGMTAIEASHALAMELGYSFTDTTIHSDLKALGLTPVSGTERVREMTKARRMEVKKGVLAKVIHHRAVVAPSKGLGELEPISVERPQLNDAYAVKLGQVLDAFCLGEPVVGGHLLQCSNLNGKVVMVMDKKFP